MYQREKAFLIRTAYLAAALAAVAQLLRLLTIVGRKDNRR